MMRIIPWAGRALLILALVGCGRGEAAPAPSKKALPKDVYVALPAADGLQPGELATVRGEEVIGRVGPDGSAFEVALRSAGDGSHLMRRFGMETMELGARLGSPGLTQYPCAACHTSTGDLQPGVDRVADAHQDIQPVHPREIGPSCTACHAPENVELLALGSGDRATLDHAYRLCAQCHAPQVDAWAAGAHGKRLDGWQGRRVVMGCADCHDPHKPALERRIPFRPPTLTRPNRRDR
jgi:hypothetical protein